MAQARITRRLERTAGAAAQPHPVGRQETIMANYREEDHLPDGALDREKLAADIRFRELDLELRREELALKRAELARNQFTSPLLLAIIAAFIGIIGNVVVTYVQGRNALIVEKERFQSSLMLEAIKTGDTGAAANNLAFLLDVGLVEDRDEAITRYLERKKRLPVLPASSSDRTCTKWMFDDATGIRHCVETALLANPITLTSPGGAER